MSRSQSYVGPVPSDRSFRREGAVVALLVLFAILVGLVAVATPPWEANDEPDHFANAASIADGRMYRVEPGAGFEPHQPPLYYTLLAGEMRLLRIDRTAPELVATADDGAHQGLLWNHSVVTDGADTRRVLPLRMAGILLGIVTVLSAYGLTRLLTDVLWTPVLAAAIAAFVPRFVFLSGVLNNDNLATALASVATFLVALSIGRRLPTRYNSAALIAAGVVLGAGLLAKLTVAPVAFVLVVAVGLWSTDRLRSVASVLAPTILVFVFWPLRNMLEYSDPFLTSTAKAYFLETLPALILETPTFRRAFVELPQGVWSSFWYTSGWNQFRWVWWAYVPFWTLTLIGLLGVVSQWSRRQKEQKRIAFLAIGVSLAGFSNVWLAGLQTTQHQARIAFVGLAAMAGLVAIGYEWVRWVPLRFALPAVGLVGTIYAIWTDVLPFA
jgi:4-amino-4-deoxy-L-arabinose transferase-like glycosyltransferase